MAFKLIHYNRDSLFKLIFFKVSKNISFSLFFILNTGYRTNSFESLINIKINPPAWNATKKIFYDHNTLIKLNNAPTETEYNENRVGGGGLTPETFNLLFTMHF